MSWSELTDIASIPTYVTQITASEDASTLKQWQVRNVVGLSLIDDKMTSRF